MFIVFIDNSNMNLHNVVWSFNVTKTWDVVRLWTPMVLHEPPREITSSRYQVTQLLLTTKATKETSSRGTDVHKILFNNINHNN